MTGNNSKTKVNELKEREKLIDLPSLKKNYDTIYDQVKSESDSFKSMWISSIKEVIFLIFLFHFLTFN